MVAYLTPLWLRAPSRFAVLSRTQARIGLVLVVALAALFLAALATPLPAAVAGNGPADGQTDILLYQDIVEGVRHRGGFYDTTAAALRAGNYPLKPFVTFRLPTLAEVQAFLPPGAVELLLYLLALMVFGIWALRLMSALERRPPQIVALMLLAGGLIVFVQPELVTFHEIWAGLLIALSLGLRRPGRWIEAAALGLIAMLIRETAAVYVAIMAAAAWWEGARREAIGWAATVAVLAIVVALHAHAVATVVRPLDPWSPGWSGLLGPGFYVMALTAATALRIAPLWLGAVLLALSFTGLAAWRDPLAARALAMFGAYGMLLSLFGRSDTFYWGLMVAPLCLVGLTFAPDALRDLWIRAWPKRRITVTRRTA